ncbi:MAG TPA: TetR/AcrR family transcriptional regulator, partial [Syntrophomonas sp.]|nr:TetR/AcrR family transcriptional regulator [Syntrophomonas sp.]
MYETFEKLPDGKKEQIIQVCIEEFVENGYKNASTNTIVKRLGISKGLLFLYFKNKKQLYLYLAEHLIKIIIQDYFGEYANGPVININIFDHLGEYYKE